MEPESMELFISRGYQTYNSKLFMRATVLFSDLLVLIPSLFLFLSLEKEMSWSWRASCMLMMLIQPTLLLVDHGHFQYNNISLGFAIIAIALVRADWDLLGSFFFCLSLNYKQMGLYFAPAFFFYLLGKNFDSRNLLSSTLKIGTIGVTVIATFFICWLPFLWSLDSVLQVLHRIFPVYSGLFEDKVANFWCSISLVIKFNKIFDHQTLVRLRQHKYYLLDTLSTLSDLSFFKCLCHSHFFPSVKFASSLQTNKAELFVHSRYHISLILHVLLPSS